MTEDTMDHQCEQCGAPLECPDCLDGEVPVTKLMCDQVLGLWNDSTHERVSNLSRITAGRKKHLRARIRMCRGFDEYLVELERCIERINQSLFATGVNSRGWRVTWDWLHKSEDNWCKVLEGQYVPDVKGMQAYRQRSEAEAGGKPAGAATNAAGRSVSSMTEVELEREIKANGPMAALAQSELNTRRARQQRGVQQNTDLASKALRKVRRERRVS